MVDAGPLPAHGEKKVGEIGQRKWVREGGKEGGQTPDKLGLVLDLVAVPHAVEEGFPELFVVIVGN